MSLRHRLEIYNPTLSVDDFNSTIKDYDNPVLIGSAWAEYLDSKTENEFIVNGESVVASLVFKIRYRSDLSDDSFVKYKGKRYKFLTVENEKELNRFLILYMVSYDL